MDSNYVETNICRIEKTTFQYAYIFQKFTSNSLLSSLNARLAYAAPSPFAGFSLQVYDYPKTDPPPFQHKVAILYSSRNNAAGCYTVALTVQPPAPGQSILDVYFKALECRDQDYTFYLQTVQMAKVKTEEVEYFVVWKRDCDYYQLFWAEVDKGSWIVRAEMLKGPDTKKSDEYKFQMTHIC